MVEEARRRVEEDLAPLVHAGGEDGRLLADAALLLSRICKVYLLV